jgi:rare lipoprotein A (peptidoglycan hydrolase)
MPISVLGRHRAAIVLLIAGSVALFGAQQVLGGVADAHTTQALVDVHDLQQLPERQPVPATATMRAAAPSGQFEDAVKPTPVPTAAPPSVEPTLTPTDAEPAAPVYESGVASTYGEGDGFEGRRTACGQVFHTHAVQVAHKSLPCGTTLRIEDTHTGRTVDALVTDRGPYIPGRIVDLSWGAFEQLNPAGPGLLSVNIYVLDDD